MTLAEIDLSSPTAILGAGCSFLAAAVVILWRRDVVRETARIEREQALAEVRRTDTVELTKAVLNTAERLNALAKAIEDGDEERRRLFAQLSSDLRSAKVMP